MRLNGFFTCPCGKLHTHGGVTAISRCPTCGRDLWEIAVVGNRPTSPREFHNIMELAQQITQELFH